MELFKKKSNLKRYLSNLKQQNKTIGFVPTMGALHQGHLSLVARAKEENDSVVVSIFINPTQFDNQQDLLQYPKMLKNDIALLKSVGCTVLFIPSVDEIYNQNIISQEFDFDGLEFEMEGKFRKGHFNGVGTIIKILFKSIEPDIAYFGKKDFQQLQIIKKLVKKHNIPIKIKGCPIFREKDGLAMSSRNIHLSKKHRKATPFIYKTLKKVKKKATTKNANQLCQWVKKEFEKQSLLKLEYFTISNQKTLQPTNTFEKNKKYRAFIAVYADKIRLIDTIELKTKNQE